MRLFSKRRRTMDCFQGKMHFVEIVGTYLIIASFILLIKVLFKRDFGEEEDQARFAVFKKNVGLVEEHNAKYDRGESSYTLGINEFSDRHSHELKHLHGLLPPPSTDEPLEQ